MCGRFALTATPEEVAALFGYLDIELFPPRYNIAPTQPIAIVRLDHDRPKFALVRWGLVPLWSRPDSLRPLVNLRSETLGGSRAWRRLLCRKRCLVPADGFYEWQKQPYWIRPRQGGVIAFAGLWETWSDRDGGEIDTGVILTTASNAMLAPIHDRMPAVIPVAGFDRWLKATENPPESVADLLAPAPDGLFEAIPVSSRVNAARNDGPDLQVPLAATGT